MAAATCSISSTLDALTVEIRTKRNKQYLLTHRHTDSISFNLQLRRYLESTKDNANKREWYGLMINERQTLV